MSSVSIGVILYSFNLGNKMTAKHSVLVDATMEAKLELTRAYLWHEKLMRGDKSVKKSQINGNVMQAKWYLNAMIKGGANKEGIFLPIDEDFPSIRTHIKEALLLTNHFEKLTYKKITNKKILSVGSTSNIEYDEVFNKAIVKIDTVEGELQNIIAKDLVYYLFIRDILILVIIAINIFVLISYRTILKFQKDWFLKYFRVEDEKNTLKKLYKELQEAQVIIDKYVPLSRTDIDGNITHVNTAMCELTGYKKDKLIGKNHRILRFPTEKKELYQDMWKKITSGDIWEKEIKNINKHGEVFWTNLHIHPLSNSDNNIIGYQSLRENITERKELEYLSSHDKLTSLFNRYHFDEVLKYEIEQYKRYCNTFSLSMLDLDYFKKVNDTYGHQIGDDVLVQSVNIMKNAIRESDVLARWGGEEFVLLLPHTNKDEAKIVLEKIRTSLENYTFETVGHITISGGLSEISKNDNSISLLKRIDDALYEAKDSGRNQIIVYS
ncbi:diguanylate cyclase [Sulfurimonas sp.]|uniref:sensor domain-containing diguanylate cyclase n=1 Tax=Sulfurimonas sp. TaxID=2022749 RepID=UPI0039E35826